MCRPFIGIFIKSKTLFTRHEWSYHLENNRAIFLTNALIALERLIDEAIITDNGAAVNHKTRATAPRSPLHAPQTAESNRVDAGAPFQPHQNAGKHHFSKMTVFRKSQVVSI